MSVGLIPVALHPIWFWRHSTPLEQRSFHTQHYVQYGVQFPCLVRRAKWEASQQIGIMCQRLIALGTTMDHQEPVLDHSTDFIVIHIYLPMCRFFYCVREFLKQSSCLPSGENNPWTIFIARWKDMKFVEVCDLYSWLLQLCRRSSTALYQCLYRVCLNWHTYTNL